MHFQILQSANEKKSIISKRQNSKERENPILFAIILRSVYILIDCNILHSIHARS